ncbi:MAG: Dolichyl-phosphate-mannose-protein mannosyltransferase [Elusimicrobia bacterium ADurb.Bin231]|nr:MAG: Dolichyl-phosphate-mannose-protein mannosyltransferase [Elusimicrobia bacterium ADurb.Bin231]
MRKNKKKETAILPQKQGISTYLPLPVLWLLTIVWGFVIFKNYYPAFRPSLDNIGSMFSPDQYVEIFNLSNLVVLNHLLNIILAAFFFFSCFSLGRLITQYFRPVWHSGFEEMVFCAGIGMCGVSLLIFLLGVFSALYKSTVLFSLVIVAALGFWDIKKHRIAGTPCPEKLPSLFFLAKYLLLFALIAGLFAALGPEIFYDSLVYHLAAPNYYKIMHGIKEMPYVLYSNLPLAHGMLFTAGLFLRNEVVAKLINYCACVLVCVSMVSFSLKYFGSMIQGILASLIFYATTHVMLSSGACGTETILTLFAFLSFYALVNYLEDGKLFFLYISGVLSGFAMAVKYTGIFVAVGVVIAYLVSKKKVTLKNILLWGIIASIPVMPWLIKNYIYKNNPVYPFMSSVFKPDNMTDPAKVKGFISETKQYSFSGFWEWAKHPWLITMGRIPNSENFSPLFLFIIPFVLLIKAPRNVIRLGIVYCFVVWLTWSLTTTMIRFIMPALPVAALLIAYFIFGFSDKNYKNLLSIIAIFFSAVNIYWGCWMFYVQGGWKVAAGSEKKEEFLSNTHPSYPYGYFAGIDYINKNLPAGAGVLFAGESRSFYLERMPVVSSVFDLTPLVEISALSGNADEIYKNLRRMGITHIFLNLGEAVRLHRSYRMFYFDEKSASKFRDFWDKYVVEVFHRDETRSGTFLNRVVVYKILEEKEASMPHDSPENFILRYVVQSALGK